MRHAESPPDLERASTLGRFAVAVLLAMGVVGFGAASLCGGLVTVFSIHDPRLWILSLPALLLGGWLARWCWRALARRWRARRVQNAPHD